MSTCARAEEQTNSNLVAAGEWGQLSPPKSISVFEAYTGSSTVENQVQSYHRNHRP